MAGMYGVSAYRQINRTVKTTDAGSQRTGAAISSKTDQTTPVKENTAPKVDAKGWSPIDVNSSLVPSKTEYGNSIGDVKLSDKAKDYYNELKSKFHNMEFIAVSSSMKGQVQKNAASYGNPNKMVVLIDEEKLERMATDDSFRKKYEGIISMSQNKLEAAGKSLAGSGAGIKNFGMSVDKDGNESFFATVEKSQELQKKRIEKKAEEKKEQKAKEKKKAEKEAAKERLKKAADKKAEKADRKTDPEKAEHKEDAGEDIEAREKEYLIFHADSLDSLISKVQKYSYDISASRVMTDEERMLGTMVDFKG